MLNQICQYLCNWFDEDSRHNRLPSWSGEITIADGELVGFADKLKVGQYFRVIDSTLNDGVYQYPPIELVDETFNGLVQSMRVPRDVIALDTEIEAWIAKYSKVINSPFQSESKADYSYNKVYSPQGGSSVVTWQSQFKAKLAPWRKA